MTLDKLHQQILNCNLCKNIFQTKPIVWWKQNAKIFQISQAPSKSVFISWKPFTDKTWEKLMARYDIPENVFYNKNNFYITAISHCFPWKYKNWWDIKPPIKCAKLWLKREIELVNNKIYIIIWSIAAKFLLPNRNYTKLIKENQVLNWKLTIVLPHPSPLNQKWFKDNPWFYEKRLGEVRKIIKKTLKQYF